MDISAVGGYEAAQVTTRMKEEESKTSSFKQVLDKAVEENDKEQIKQACQEFESYFIQMMFKQMRSTVHSENGVIPKSYTEEVFQDMLDEEYSKDAAKSGGVGLADMMYKQLTRNQ